MRTIAGWCVVAGLAAAVPAARAQQATGYEAAAQEPQVLEPVEQLRTLEEAASTRPGSRAREATREEYAAVSRAAGSYARDVAGGDDLKFSILAARAMDQALAMRRNLVDLADGADGGRAVVRELAPSAARVESQTPSVNASREFLRNVRKLMEAASESGADLAPVIPGQRIVGGRPVSPGAFPDCVAVGSRGSGGDEYCCTGTLIGKNVVLTAGHCFPCTGASSVVYIGDDISKPGQTYVGKAFQHPEYGRGGLHNDLTVIILADDVAGVAPRRIAAAAEIDAAPFVRAVGFGNSDRQSTMGFGVKRVADIPVASKSCGTAADRNRYGCDRDLELVAGMKNLNRDTCNGDSGGPVYVQVGPDPGKPESWALAGATSRATRQAVLPCGDGGVYPRVDRYLDSFIRKVPGARF